MYCATESRRMQILVWLIWAIACLVVLSLPEAVVMAQQEGGTSTILAGVVTHDPGNGPLFPWQPRHRWRRWAWRHYKAWQRACRRAVWIARLGRLAMVGALSLAHLVDWVSRSQLRRHMGALPVLYALLETLQVRHVINRNCPTRAKVDHGTVAMVLVLNRLLMPLPLYQVADWLARTVLVYTLGIPAARFNDDRLARTLDAIQPRCHTVKAVQHRARAKLKSSPVGKLMHAQAYTDEQGQVCLRWWVDANALRQKMERDGRYLLVTNNEALSAKQMLALYHQKDGVEKRICVSKNQLKVSPVYLHKDERIEAMLLINMLALLTYSLLERQVRQGGLQMTTRRIIEKLQGLHVVETCCWDGSYLLRLAPLDSEQIMLLQVLAPVPAELRIPRWSHPSLPTRTGQRWSLPPPRNWQPVH
jgi:hypothetical protein